MYDPIYTMKSCTSNTQVDVSQLVANFLRMYVEDDVKFVNLLPPLQLNFEVSVVTGR